VATPDKPNDHVFVVDFSKGNPKPDHPADWTPDIEIVMAGGKAKLLDKRVMLNTETGGWRAFFKMEIPPTTHLLELTCDLLEDKQPVSERWTYQWKQ
jgi:glucans biosynthesis protein